MRTRGMSKKSSAGSGEEGPSRTGDVNKDFKVKGSCDWDLLSDDVVAYEIVAKIKRPIWLFVDPEEAPFHPRLVLQCARKGLFEWSPDRLIKLLSLKPVGPFIQEVQEALRSHFEGREDARFNVELHLSHPLFACKSLQRLNATFKNPEALKVLHKRSGSLQSLCAKMTSRPRSAVQLADNLSPLTRLTALTLTLNKGCGGTLDFAFLSKLTALRELYLAPGPCYGSLQPHFAALPALESLALRECDLTPEALAPLDLSTQLTRIALEYCKFEDNPLSRLTTLTSLAELLIPWEEPPETLPANLLSSLTHVGILRIPAWLSGCTALEEYSGACKSATDLALLQPLTRLTFLYLKGSGSRCTSLAPLSSLVNLQELSVRYFGDMQDFSALSRMTALTSLGVSDVRSFAGFSALASLPSLRYLEADSIVSFAEGQFEHLARLTTLTHLELSHSTDVDDAALSPLRALAKNLRLLNLGSTEITDQGVRDTLVHLTGLTKLNVDRCENVTAKGLRCLSSLGHLKRLGVNYTVRKELEGIRKKDPSFLRGVDVF